MLLASAQSAGALAAQIATVTQQIGIINTLLANNAVITGGSLSVFDSGGLGAMSQTIQALSVAESATVFNTMLTILNARLSTWQASLGAM